MAITLRLTRQRGFAKWVGEAAIASVWRLAISVRAAIVTVLFLSMTALAGVLLPQIPTGIRGDPDLTAAWLEVQRSRFGFLTSPLHRLGLFDMFHAWWFWGLMAWLAFAIVACTANRLPRIWRQALQPPRRIDDSLFEPESVVALAVAASPERLERGLRRRLFKVWRIEEGGATYLFADRFPWARFGTLAIHLALIVFLVGALITKFTGFSTDLAIAEGTSAPIFPVAHEQQILVGVENAVGAFAADGRPLDFRSDLVLYRNGLEAKRCTATVNEPCSFAGYTFHQAGFFGYGGELLVRDIATGNTVYREVIPLDQALPAPQVTIRNGDGNEVFAGTVPPTQPIGDSLGGLVALPEAETMLWVGLNRTDGRWQLAVVDPSQPAGSEIGFVPLGGNAEIGDYRFDFDRVVSMPSSTAAGIPVPPDDGSTGDGQVLVTLQNAIFGTREASAGDVRLDGSAAEPPVLHIAGIAPEAVQLGVGERIELGPYEYEFVGTRNFSGIAVKKDRGDTLIWVASTLFVLGLVIMLWLPRRRAWLRFRDGELRMVGNDRERIDLSDLAGNT